MIWRETEAEAERDLSLGYQCISLAQQSLLQLPHKTVQVLPLNWTWSMLDSFSCPYVWRELNPRPRGWLAIGSTLRKLSSRGTKRPVCAVSYPEGSAKEEIKSVIRRDALTAFKTNGDLHRHPGFLCLSTRCSGVRCWNYGWFRSDLVWTGVIAQRGSTVQYGTVCPLKGPVAQKHADAVALEHQCSPIDLCHSTAVAMAHCQFLLCHGRFPRMTASRLKSFIPLRDAFHMKKEKTQRWERLPQCLCCEELLFSGTKDRWAAPVQKMDFLRVTSLKLK